MAEEKEQYQNVKLTLKQELFVKEYLANGFNGRQAAITAGYSEDSANVIASENLSKPYIKSAIEAEILKIKVEKKITAERILDEIGKIALEQKGIRPSDKLKALELLGRYRALFTDTMRHQGEIEVVFDIPRPEQDNET